jgi:hypothetical protein
MDEEIQGLLEIQTFEETEILKSEKIAKTKFVFKTKMDVDGNVLRRKARFVACGYSQRPGVDFDETYAQVGRMVTIRALLRKCAIEKLYTRHADIERAYTNASINERIIINKHGDPGKFWILKRALYGLKQSAKAWNDELNNTLLKQRFQKAKSEPCLYIRNAEMVVVVVDDLFMTAPISKQLDDIIEELSAFYKIKDLGPIHHAIGMKFQFEENYVQIS